MVAVVVEGQAATPTSTAVAVAVVVVAAAMEVTALPETTKMVTQVATVKGLDSAVMEEMGEVEMKAGAMVRPAVQKLIRHTVRATK